MGRMRTSRRTFCGALAAGAVVPFVSARPSRADASLRFNDDPFRLGIASGFPTSEGCVLWTRLAPSPLEPGGGLTDTVVPVGWEIATDERLERVVQKGTAYATFDWAHSVHVEPAGLEAGRPYWYRFTAGG